MAAHMKQEASGKIYCNWQGSSSVITTIKNSAAIKHKILCSNKEWHACDIVST